MISTSNPIQPNKNNTIMSSRVDTANALAMNASSAFHALSSQCIHYAKILEERDEEIKELKNSLKMRGGIFPEEVEELTAHYEDECDKNEKLTEENKELKEENKKLKEDNERLDKQRELDIQRMMKGDEYKKELTELKEQLEPLEEAMDGWTGVCNFQDVVNYVESEKEKIEQRDEIIVEMNDNLGVIHNFLTIWGDEDDANKEYPPSKKQLLDLANDYAVEQEPYW